METSILVSTKKILGLSAEYTAFDLDIITHINATLSTLTQLGVGPTAGYMIDDDLSKWEDFISTNNPMLNMVKTYVFLKVKYLFDTPTTPFLIEAVTKQIAEFEWRLNEFREELIV